MHHNRSVTSLLLAFLALAGCYGSRGPLSPEPELAPADAATTPLITRVCPAATARVCCGDTICAEGEMCHHGCERDGTTRPTCTPSRRIAAERCGDLDITQLVVVCDGPEDCSDDEACVLFLGNVVHETRCAEAGRDELCHTAADCDEGRCVSLLEAWGHAPSALSEHAICVP